MTEDPVPYNVNPRDVIPWDPTPRHRPLLEVARDLAAAKAAEEEAKARRVALEEELAAMVPPAEGRTQTTATLPGLKVTVKRGMRYKVDPECFKEAIDPSIYEGCFKHKETWDVVPTRYEALRQLNPQAFAVLSRHITATPSKPYVELKWEGAEA